MGISTGRITAMTHTLTTLLDMPVDELRFKIAEIQGWKEVPDKYYLDKRAFVKGERRVASVDIPEYESCLNEMRVLEDGLTDEEREEYVIKLHAVVGLTTGKLKHEWQYDFAIATAKAHHRAVAFVLTKMKL